MARKKRKDIPEFRTFNGKRYRLFFHNRFIPYGSTVPNWDRAEYLKEHAIIDAEKLRKEYGVKVRMVEIGKYGDYVLYYRGSFKKRKEEKEKK
jgi:hypothetical protein